MNLLIYTDGGCSGNPGPGGWGYVLVDGVSGESLEQKWGAEAGTTNNRMELSAVINAFESVEQHAQWAALSCTVYTDSQYVQKGISEWIHSWKRNGWRTASKAEVKNKDLWQRLDALASRRSIEWRWVKGHAGNRWNEVCDAMTQEAIASLRS
jgi:ribonuclease HI